MARINWRFVFKIMKAHGWREIDICRKIGISQPHWCDLKHGRRKPSLAFADCLCHTLQCTYDSILIHPTVERAPSAREILALTELEDGRPWPGQETIRDHRTSYQQWQREQDLAARLEIRPRKDLS